MEVGARYDWTRIDPLDTSPGMIGEVRRLDFQSVYGSVAAMYRPADEWTAGVSISRSFRTPSIEELFSNGPHLANYSYDIGNPDLDAEYGLFAGLGVEGAARQERVGEFEQPTPAYALLNAIAGLRWTAFDRLNTPTLQVQNVLDTAWRDHLSRIRLVARQPGRNVQLLYRLAI